MFPLPCVSYIARSHPSRLRPTKSNKHYMHMWQLVHAWRHAPRASRPRPPAPRPRPPALPPRTAHPPSPAPPRATFVTAGGCLSPKKLCCIAIPFGRAAEDSKLQLTDYRSFPPDSMGGLPRSFQLAPHDPSPAVRAPLLRRRPRPPRTRPTMRHPPRHLHRHLHSAPCRGRRAHAPPCPRGTPPSLLDRVRFFI